MNREFPAVHDEISRREKVGELPDHLSGRLTGGDHHPYRTGSGQYLDQCLQAGHVADLRIRVIAHRIVPSVP